MGSAAIGRARDRVGRRAASESGSERMNQASVAAINPAERSASATRTPRRVSSPREVGSLFSPGALGQWRLAYQPRLEMSLSFIP